MKKIVFLLCLILFNYSLKAQENELPAFVTDSLENYIIRGMTKWEIPGLSIAIVKNGKIQFMKGFGTTKAGGFEPVDENTLFMIGSITKTFTSTAISLLQSDGKLSIDDTRTEIPVTQLDNLAPAASMSSSAKDMATWLLAHLNNGKIDESQVIPGSAVQTIRRPHTIIGMDTRYKQLTHFSLYGLGLHIKDRKGIVVYSHAGGVPGFVSSWLFVPEENLGITILTNTDYNLFCSDLENEILDAFLGLPYQGYSNKSFEILKQYRLDTKNNRNRIRLSYLIRISVPDFHSFPESSFFRNQTITNFVINFINYRMSEKNIQVINSKNDTNDYMNFQTIPKVENHLHLEGAIPLETIWQLIQKYGGDRSVSDINQLQKRFVYKNFYQFIETWIWKNQFIREYEDFALLTGSVLQDLIRQNVKYAEVFISPSLFKDRLQTQRIVESISNEIKRHKKIQINLIVDLVRNYEAKKEMITLHEINEVKNFGIIGIGIGGSENEYPPELFKDVYEKARHFGFKTTAHAGEADGPASIWGALLNLKVDRIGHGTRAAEDKELLNYLANNKIPVEVCPLSNLRTKVISTMKDHPVKTFIDAGIPVSINTDDPKMFNNSLSEEYQSLQDTFNYSDQDIQAIIINSIDIMWLDKKDKEKLVSEMKKI